ncbi:Phosphoenolpyruvate-protein phosphotransferase [Austwickia sp. TVS 96-490-7B]|uniref:phosphoenolpyruvate--protein phosphotransferase n=1 Tax=Austwickia sp. TVS 96-490-7B TaxID=2830843 RepID=UPI001C58A217|nr:phosphoenolpyruvate--protein phosphotransferase [Austwickia sp. TVS 96-490-7B]MBW3086141.1 Phosphoenolpyruvate-protein phosphotransferase [Austwickia sp. TVS 96-490-7B]
MTRHVIHGIGVSAGTASGPVVHVRPAPGFDPNEAPTTDATAASRRVTDALEQVATGLEARLAKASDHAKPVLQATAMMARDPGLVTAIDGKLGTGLGLTRAVHDAVEDYCAMFESLGGYMAERVTDLRDVRDRTICRLLGVAEPGVPDLRSPSVLAAHDLAPAETATLARDKVLGIVTSAGGPTSHTAILAAQLGIPAVVQAKGITDTPDGTIVALDGGVGEVVVDPSPADISQLSERARRRSAALAGSSGEGATYDGHKVALLANIGTAADARAAAAQDLEGSGLFRTEFLFLDRESAPTLDEQTATYTEVLRAFGTRRVVVRTLDAGADKPLPFADLGPEENPALGRRGLRLGMIREDLLDTQLKALAAAYRATGADIRVMAPMVGTVEEAEYFAAKVRAVGLPKVGVMVEVPAAALRADHLLSVVDFASLGTNDLQQYTMAADRMQGELATLLDPWQPALLQLVRSTCEGGRATGKPIGVCGEAGGDPLLALVLVGLGVSSLSMAPGKVSAVRASLRLHDLATCQQMAAYAVAARTAKDARNAVQALVHPQLLDLL